ncbi:MAG: hypothetical protein EOP56_14280 [Sphingobacteriales bacterium]|nr:MAG: hypothetical protein EOP56_14280 [Sphingobacteriales bacterium]
MFRGLFSMLITVLAFSSCGKKDKEPVKTGPAPVVYNDPIDTTVGVYMGNIIFTYRSIVGDSMSSIISDSGGIYPDVIMVTKLDVTHFELSLPDGFKIDKDSPVRFDYNPANTYIKTRSSATNGNDTIWLQYFWPDSIFIETRIGASSTESHRWSRHYQFTGKK